MCDAERLMQNRCDNEFEADPVLHAPFCRVLLPLAKPLGSNSSIPVSIHDGTISYGFDLHSRRRVQATWQSFNLARFPLKTLCAFCMRLFPADFVDLYLKSVNGGF